MMGYIFLAIFNGIIIGTSRAINGRLSVNVGPFKASFCNHIVGFLFLTSFFVLQQMKFGIVDHIPVYTYLAGFFGAFFVAINSYVFSRIGATVTTILVISAQMIFSVCINYKTGGETSMLIQFSGIMMIVMGVYLAKSHASFRQASGDV